MSTSIITRMRSHNPIIDLRLLPEESIVDLSALDVVDKELRVFGHPHNLRVWVLHEATTQWTADPDTALKAMRRLYDIAKKTSGGSAIDAAVMVGSAQTNRQLIYLLRSIGFAPFPLRAGGGLPVQEIDLGDGLWAGMAPPASPGNFPKKPELAQLFAQQDDGEEVEEQAIAQLIQEALDW